MSGISPATAIPASAARIAEDGALMIGGAELEEAEPVLSFRDRGFSEGILAKTADTRLDSEDSLGWFDIVDKMEVEKEDEACCLRCDFGITSEQRSSPPHPRRRSVYANSTT